MRYTRLCLMVAVALAVVPVVRPAQAQTVTWVTPPPHAINVGGTFTVEWRVSGFAGPGDVNNRLAWGAISLARVAPRRACRLRC